MAWTHVETTAQLDRSQGMVRCLIEASEKVEDGGVVVRRPDSFNLDESSGRDLRLPFRTPDLQVREPGGELSLGAGTLTKPERHLAT